MKRQFCATAYIFNKRDEVLFIFHPKMRRWMPPGGHVEPNETPPETAIREAKEEADIDITLIEQENLWVTSNEAKSLHRPYLCLLEEIPATAIEPAHQHIDFIYLARPKNPTVIPHSPEGLPIQWFSKENIDELPQNSCFPDTHQFLEHYFSQISCLS